MTMRTCTRAMRMRSQNYDLCKQLIYVGVTRARYTVDYV